MFHSESKRINQNIQKLLTETVKSFEDSIVHDSITAQEYWKQFFKKTCLGETIYIELQLSIGKTDTEDIGRCSKFVLGILENFDKFKKDNPIFYFPVENLGRCRMRGYNVNGADIKIPHYNLYTDDFLEWNYHEVIVVINDEDLSNDDRTPILNNALIYDININKIYLFTISRFVKKLIPIKVFSIFKSEMVIPAFLIFQITHRFVGAIINLDKWNGIEGRTVRINDNWYN